MSVARSGNIFARAVQARLRCKCSLNKGRIRIAPFHSTRRTLQDSNNNSWDLLEPNTTPKRTITETTPKESTSELFTAIESLQPQSSKKRKLVLSNSKYKDLQSQLNHQFTKPQLQLYLKSKKQHASSKLRKTDLLRMIITDVWGIKSTEDVKKEAERQKKDYIETHHAATRPELYFMLGDNGATLKAIEEECKVNIQIFLDDCQYSINGQEPDVKKAEKKIKESLNLVQEEMDLPETKTTISAEYLNASINPILHHISRGCYTYIELENGKFSLTARNHDDISKAKRILNLAIIDLDLTTKRPLDAADDLYIECSWQPRAQEPGTTTTTTTTTKAADNSRDTSNNVETFDSATVDHAAATSEHLQSSASNYSLSNTDSTVNRSEQNVLSFMPVHDSRAMPLTAKASGWCRVFSLKPSEQWDDSALSFYHLSSREGGTEGPDATGLNIKQRLTDRLQLEKGGNVYLGAKFGHVLFENPPFQDNVFLSPSLLDSFDKTNLKEHLGIMQRRRFFFATQAPSSITSPLIPINYAKGRLHQRFVNVEYVNANAFNTQNNTSSPFSRLSMTFTVDDAGHLSPEEIIGEHERSVVDLIAIKGFVDAQILTKRYTLLCNKESEKTGKLESEVIPDIVLEAIGRSKLTGYTDLECPTAIDVLGDEMQLAEISFCNEARYMIDDSLLTVRDIERINAQSRGIEYNLTPFQADTVPLSSKDIEPIANGLDRWDTFMNNIASLASRWKYLVR